MNIVGRIRSWLTGRIGLESVMSESLREFVYLDEVSVYSLLASRKRGIVTQLTESQTAALNSELGSSFNIGFAGLGSEIGSKTQRSLGQATQVIRKATVQNSFKELYDLERERLAVVASGVRNQLGVGCLSDVEKSFESLARDKWIVDIGNLKRGDLLEAKVVLETDPIFRMTTVIGTLYEFMGDREDIFGAVPANQVREAYAIGQVLERLLAGLVPLRGRMVDYEAITLRDREVLAHRRVREQLKSEYSGVVRPVYVTGVADHGLFWKDIRQILFSGSQYNALCRLVTQGLKEDWQPVKLADMFEGVIGDFREAISSLGEAIRVAMEDQSHIEEQPLDQDEPSRIQVIKEYVELLGAYHRKCIPPDFAETTIIPVMPLGDWLSSVVARRAVFDEATKLVEEEFGVQTPGEARHSLREKVLGKPDLGIVRGEAALAENFRATKSRDLERFLDTEIVAIYW